MGLRLVVRKRRGTFIGGPCGDGDTANLGELRRGTFIGVPCGDGDTANLGELRRGTLATVFLFRFWGVDIDC